MDENNKRRQVRLSIKKLKSIFKKNRLLLLITLLLFGVLAVTHLLFYFPAPSAFFVAKWTAGELLTFLSTVALGCVAVIQTHIANQTAKQATQISERLMKKELADVLPFIDIRPLSKAEWAKCSIEKCLRLSVDDCCIAIDEKLQVHSLYGELLFFGLKNVCNHDILDVSIINLIIEIPNQTCAIPSFENSIYDGSLAAWRIDSVDYGNTNKLLCSGCT